MASAQSFARLATLTLGVVIGCVHAFAGDNHARLNGTADYAFINGKIYTMNEAQPWAEAVTVEGNKITYVGDASGLKEQIGYDTEVVDLGGKMMLPGFVDGHLHAVAGGVIANGVDLQTDDKAELMQRIKDYVKDNPDKKLIHGYGVRLHIWNDDWPTAAMLDEIEFERPVYLWAIDGHKAWVNSKALELAGITKDTKFSRRPSISTPIMLPMALLSGSPNSPRRESQRPMITASKGSP
jgi:predicted amidohydrolase YtcJ